MEHTQTGGDVRAELEKNFGKMGEDTMSEALSILRLYGLTASDLFFKWEAFLLSSTTSSNASHRGLQFNLDNLGELRKEIQSSANASSSHIKKEHATPAGPGGSSRIKKLGSRAALDGILDGSPSTPLGKKARAGGATPSSLTPLARTAFRSTAPSTLTPHPKPNVPSHLSRSSTNNSLATPPSGIGNLDSPASSATVPFEDRKNALEVVESLNAQLPAIIGSATEASTSRIALASNTETSRYSYRYMFEKLTERADVLDSAIDECGEQIKQYYGLEELGNPCFDSQEDLYCVGRICPESDGVKLTETTIHFESSRRYGSSERVQFRFDPDFIVRSSDNPTVSAGEGGVGLFPGMIVGAKGRNAGGGYFIVSEILLMPPVDQPESTLDELLDYQYGKHKLDGQPMSIITASGPYTVDDDLHYAPLAALLQEASNTKPDLVILLGPFVDSSHPLIKSGDVDSTPARIFADNVSKKITSFLDWSSNTTIILIPSPRDMISHHVAYPQAPLEKEGLDLHKRAKLLPNPATFQVNEIVFAVTSVDTFFSLKSQEFFKKARDPTSMTTFSDPDSSMTLDSTVSQDAMARICRHVLRQRSFYPLFPSPQQPPLDALNLDVTHGDLLKFNNGTGADIFIIPSMLKHFAKVVDSAVMVNSASLARKNMPGTFAKLTIYPTDKSELKSSAGMSSDNMQLAEEDEEEENLLDHKVYERCRVDIVRV